MVNGTRIAKRPNLHRLAAEPLTPLTPSGDWLERAFASARRSESRKLVEGADRLHARSTALLSKCRQSVAP